MDRRDAAAAGIAAIEAPETTQGARVPLRAAWHALALLMAGVVTWFVFAAYRQPDLILDIANLRLC
jgi:hypothetical protein